MAPGPYHQHLLELVKKKNSSDLHIRNSGGSFMPKFETYLSRVISVRAKFVRLKILNYCLSAAKESFKVCFAKHFLPDISKYHLTKLKVYVQVCLRNTRLTKVKQDSLL